MYYATSAMTTMSSKNQLPSMGLLWPSVSSVQEMQIKSVTAPQTNSSAIGSAMCICTCISMKNRICVWAQILCVYWALYSNLNSGPCIHNISQEGWCNRDKICNITYFGSMVHASHLHLIPSILTWSLSLCISSPFQLVW